MSAKIIIFPFSSERSLQGSPKLTSQLHNESDVFAGAVSRLLAALENATRSNDAVINVAVCDPERKSILRQQSSANMETIEKIKVMLAAS